MTLEERCPACGAAFKPDAAFCAECGRKRHEIETEGVGFSIKLYIALLGVQVLALIASKVGALPIYVFSYGTGALALITFATAAVHRGLVAPQYRRVGFGPLGYLLVLCAAPVVLALVAAYVHGLERAFGVAQPGYLEQLGGRVDVAFGVLVIAPPLFEELAFRGLIYGALAKSVRRSEVYAISSFAFAMLHLSVPSLLTHIPLGLYFCWLRERSGSMYPSMFAHFCHNLGVLLAELYGWA